MSQDSMQSIEDENLQNDLDRASKGDIPSPWGETIIKVNVEPVSVSSSGNTKNKLRSIMLKECKQFQFLLSGDVQIEIVWMVHERYRYEYHKAPDIDNVIKPIIDSITGPRGILIDDTQVQYIGCRWIDWARNDHRLTITLKYVPDEFVQKTDLRFIEFDHGLCFPLNVTFQEKGIKVVIDAISAMLSAQKHLEQEGLDYYTARSVLPIQRFFHRNKLTSFKIVRKDELICGA